MLIDKHTSESCNQRAAVDAGDSLFHSKRYSRDAAGQKRRAIATARLIEPIPLHDDSPRRLHGAAGTLTRR